MQYFFTRRSTQFLRFFCFVGSIAAFGPYALAQTFQGTAPLPVPPSGSQGITQSPCSVSGIGVLGGCSQIASVSIDINHTWTGDVGILLVAPNGVFIDLTSSNGGAADNWTNCTFSDNTANPFITSGFPPYSGTWRPEGRATTLNFPYSNANPLGTATFLNTFTGVNADGQWTLYVNDFVSGDIGVINSWSITFVNLGTPPAAFPASLNACGSGGAATFNLTSLNNIINGGTSSTVTFYTNASATSPISNPSAYFSASTTVYAVVNNGVCSSAPVPITLSVSAPTLTGTPTLVLTPNSGCVPTASTIQYSVGQAGSFTVNFTISPGAPSITNTLPNGTLNIPITFLQSSTVTINWVRDVGSTCNYATPPLSASFTASTAPTITLMGSNTICAGTSINLTSIASSTSPLTFHSGIPATTANQLPFTIVSPTTTTIYYASTGAGVCSNTVPVPINVTPSYTPNIGSGIVCQNNTSFSLITLQDLAYPLGAWSGPGVTGSTFNATGLGPIENVIWTPTGCGIGVITSIEIIQPTTPTLSPATICSSSGLFNLNTIADPLVPSGTWSGTGVSGTNFNPIGQNGPVLLTFTPTGGCGSPANTVITVTPGATANVSNANICLNGSTLNLVTLQDPLFPSGTWTGTGVSGTIFTPPSPGTFALTFTPSAACALPDISIIIVSAAITPSLQTGSTCQGSNLNLTSLVDPDYPIGTWSGQGVSGNIFNPTGLSGSITLTFTSNIACTDPATTTIQIGTGGTPTLGTANLCSSASALSLSTLADPLFPNGTWSGTGVLGNTFNPTGLNGAITLTFNALGTCANQTSTVVNVTPSATPNVSNANICLSAAPLSLVTLQDPLFPAGTWSGTGVSGTTFTPPSAGTFSLTFTPSVACALPDNSQIVVSSSVTPNLQLGSICQGAGTLNLTSLVDPAFPLGAWSGQGVSSNLFSPTGLSGSISLTFTSNNACANPATTTVQIGTGGTPTLGTANLCSSASALSLSTLADPLFPNGTWSGTGVSGNTFNPTGLNGAISLTFNALGTCANQASTTIQVTPALTPTLQVANICANGTPLNLNTLRDPAYQSGTWSGTGVTGTTFVPTTTGTFPVTFTSSQQCIQPATTQIYVNALGVPQLGTTTICAGGSSYNLTSLVDPTFPGGTWTGSGVSGTLFNPTGLSGGVNLTFTPSNACATPASTTIQISPTGTPNLGTRTLCSNAGPIDLTTLQDPNFISGVWSGQGVGGTIFNPAGLSGTINLTFNPTDPCANNATTTIQVSASATPNLQTANLCSNAAPLNLITLTDPAFSSGTWSGQGVSNGVFNPAGLSGTVPLTFSSSQSCVSLASTTLQVNAVTTPTLGTAVLCQNSTTLNLSSLAPSGQSAGTWSGVGVSNNFFNPAVPPLGAVNLTFTSSAQCVLPASTVVSVQPALQTNNISFDCQGSTSSYVVSFNISGGDPTTYSVNNQPAGLSYTSAPVPSASTYTFQVSDANGCGPVVLSGDFDCSCATFSGTMANAGTLQRRCQNTPITAVFNQNQNLDSDDVLLFVLHTSPNATLGTILATSTTPTFARPATAALNTTYYISAVAGTSGGANGFQANDPCLSVSQGVPVSWYALQLQASTTGSVCAQDCQTVSTQAIGLEPIRLIYRVQSGSNTQLDTVLLTEGAGNFQICPAALGLPVGNYTVTAIQLSDPNCAETISANLGSFTVVQPSFALNQTLCVGESLTIGSQTFNQANPNGQVTLAGASALGCDSLVQVSLSFAPSANFNFTQQLCVGGSVSVGGQVFNAANPAGSVTIPAASVNGCDSIVIVDLSFVAATQGFINQSICGSETLTVGTQTFSASNLTGSVTLTNASFLGCDSIVLVNLTIGQPAVGQFTQQLCTGQALTIGNQTFTQANPAGSVTLAGAAASGCDSVVQVSLTYGPAVVNVVSQTLCTGQTFAAGGQIFTQANPTGSVTIPNGSFSGCDSVVQVSLTYGPVVVNVVSQTLCAGQTYQAGGQVFSQANPTGSVTIPNGSVSGCDSVVQVSLTYGPAVVNVVNQTLCVGQTFAVGGQIFSQANPTGTVTIPNGSASGCDSVVQVSLTYGPAVVNVVNQTLCAGQTYQAGGQVFSQANPTGTVTIPNGSVSGCDSVVQVSLTYGPAVVNVVSQTLCAGQTFAAGGQIFSQANPTGTVTIPNGSISGCDSVVQVNLLYAQPILSTFAQQLCTGSSITIGNQTFSATNPSGTLVFPNAAASGCDSTVVVNLTFGGQAINQLSSVLCINETLQIGTQTFSVTNPSGSVLFPNGSYLGCDSLVQVSLSFAQPSVQSLVVTICPNDTFTVANQSFTQSNPTGTVVYAAGSYLGCDSILQVTVLFRNAAQGSLVQQLCAGESLTVGGEVFDVQNPSGQVVLPGASAFFCDSVVQVSLSFAPSANTTLVQQLCPGGFLQVGGTRFDELNPAGQVVLPNASALGCDSTVQVALTFGSQVVNVLNQSLCAGEEFAVGAQTFNESNPQGSVVFPNGSVFGCDSLVQVNLTFFPPANGFLSPQLCFGDSAVINGKLYNAQQPDGTEVFEAGSQNGCDSTLTVQLRFYAEATGTLDTVILLSQTIDVNGTTYGFDKPEGVEYLQAANGCDSTLYVRVRFDNRTQVYVPNVISLNSNTPYLTIYGGADLAEIELFQVYTRWGDEVFRRAGFAPNQAELGWDGLQRGKALNPGVYVYQAVVRFIDGTTALVTGDVALVR
jgi:subtilisin-like proprotein convertase family protein